LLFASRKDIESYIRQGNIPFKEDSSNKETHYLRNRLRHVIIPEMEDTFPGFRLNILQTISNIRNAEQLYQAVIAERSSQLLKKDHQQIRIAKAGLKELDPLNTWLFELLKPYHFNAETCEQIVASLDNEPGRFFYSATHRLLVDREELIIIPVKNSDKENNNVFIDKDRGSIDHPVLMEWKVLNDPPETLTNEKSIAYLDHDTLQFPLEVRRWQEGDYFCPLGMKGRKKLSDFFIDEKLSRIEKEETWLLCSGGEIAWVIGHRIDERFKVTGATERVLIVKWTG
jgi:tRNA(Ile)-lysidine synthase